MERIVPLPQGLRSVVCIPAIFVVVVVVVVLFCFVLLRWALINSFRSFRHTGNRDAGQLREKLNSGCMRL